LVGPGVQSGFKDDEVGRFWTWMGLAGGPVILDQLITVFHAVHPSGQPARLSLYLQPDAGVPPEMQAAVATAILPQSDAVAQAFFESHLLLMQAKAAEDPDRAAFLREKARDWIVRCGRAFLAGQPLPRPQRPPASRVRKSEEMRGLPPKEKPTSFEMLDNLVTAAFSGRRDNKRKKS
jgi:hypothetical protein